MSAKEEHFLSQTGRVPILQGAGNRQQWGAVNTTLFLCRFYKSVKALVISDSPSLFMCYIFSTCRGHLAMMAPTYITAAPPPFAILLPSSVARNVETRCTLRVRQREQEEVEIVWFVHSRWLTEAITCWEAFVTEQWICTERT